jgi:lysine decarboxylase
LFFLGIGSKEDDVEILLAALDLINLECQSQVEHAPPQPTEAKPPSFEQVFSPREAFFMPSHMVPQEKAVGQISAECRAPCPPGWPVLIPGQRIGEEVMQLEDVDLIRIIKST